eukprot:m.321645 g.321645  ORF g.321645 m.321645 type:complete len:210 (-) comp25687_c0_seq1:31-660(-)
MSEIQEEQQRLAAIRDEIGSLNERVRALRQDEMACEARIKHLQTQTLQRGNFDVKSKVLELQNEITRREQTLSELQVAFERAMQDKMTIQEQLQKVMTVGDAAGIQRVLKEETPARYEPDVAPAMTGRSNDTLGQSPAVHVMKKTLAAGGGTTDSLGNGTASPRVNKQDYVVEGERPQTAQGSSRFEGWRKPSSRVTQPPGGRSSNIFG